MFSLAMMGMSASAIVEPVELEVAAVLRTEPPGGFAFVTYCFFVDMFVDDSAKPGMSAFGCEAEWSEWLPWVLTQYPSGPPSHTNKECLFFRLPLAFMKHAITPALRSLFVKPPKSSPNLPT